MTTLAALRNHWRPLAHWLVFGAAIGYLGLVAPGIAGEIARAFGALGHPRWGWLTVTVLCGVLALVVYGELHRQLLLVGGGRLSVAAVQSINFVENAISVTVPVVGGAGALAYAIDQLRRRRVDAALASWSVLVASVISTITLLVLGSLGLGATGRIPLGMGILVAAIIGMAAAGMWKLLSHPAVLRVGLRRLVRLGRFIPGLCHTCSHAWTLRADQVSARLATRLGLLRPSAPRWLGLIALAALPWLLDFASLTASTRAVDAAVPWGTLLLGFLLVQASIALQILPGGAGLAETSLLGLLLAAGVAPVPAAASVLLYRSITWLGLALFGWAFYAISIHTSPIHLHRHAPEQLRHA